MFSIPGIAQHSPLSRLSRVGGVLLCAGGIVVLFGWWQNITALQSIVPGMATMKPNTAVSFVLAGAALYLLVDEAAGVRQRVVAGLLGGLVMVLGLAVLYEQLSGLNLHIDTLLFAQTVRERNASLTGRMSGATAFNFFLGGAALLDIARSRRAVVAQCLGLAVFLSSGLAALGYLYGVEALYAVAPYASMALHTALGFLLLGASILSLRPDVGLMRIVSGKGAGGVMARRLLPAVMIMPPVLGWIRLLGQRRGWYELDFGVAAYTASCMVVLALLVWFIAHDLERLDQRRRLAEERRFLELLEATPDAHVVVDRRGLIMACNTQAERLFGYEHGAMHGQPVDALLPESLRERHEHQRDDYFARPRLRTMDTGLELFGKRRDGAEFPVEISLAPLQTDSGMLVSSAIRDITERKRIEQVLAEKNLALRTAAEAKNRFLANMSHELRTPLNAIIGFTGTLLMRLPGPLTADQERQLSTVKHSAQHLLSLINDLLDVARIEAGRMEVNIEAVACSQIVEEVATTLGPAARQKGLEFETCLPPVEVTIRTDRRALTQIVINLVNNAIKYTSSGRIDLVLASRGTGAGTIAEFAISDTGCGIKPEDRPRLFNAFSQLDSSSTRRYEGTGLGLHLSQQLAELLGAHIGFDSEYGKGSTFTLTIGDSPPEPVRGE